MKSFNSLILELLHLAPWKNQKGIFGISLGGGQKKAKEKLETTTDINKQKTTDLSQTKTSQATGSETGNTTQSQTSSVSGEESLSLLDEGTQQVLTDLVASLAGGANQGELSGLINERALNADEDLAGITEPIVANQRSKLEDRLGQTIQGLSRAAGSSQNSLVQQLGLDEAAAVEREVADLAATLGLQTRQIATSEQQGALGGTASVVAELANVLKGAQQTGTSNQQTQALTELLSLLQTEQDVTENVDSIETVVEKIRANELAKGKKSDREASFGLSLGI